MRFASCCSVGAIHKAMPFLGTLFRNSRSIHIEKLFVGGQNPKHAQFKSYVTVRAHFRVTPFSWKKKKFRHS